MKWDEEYLRVTLYQEVRTLVSKNTSIIESADYFCVLNQLLNKYI